MPTNVRPPFIVATSDVPEEARKYRSSDESLGASRRISGAVGLAKIGLHLYRLPPGCRTSWPHAESEEEEFVYVLEGEVEAWVNGETYPMTSGDLAGFPAGTGICHTFINNGDREALLLVGGETQREDNRIFYPLHPHRREEIPASEWWCDHPILPQGPHDGKPDRLRAVEPPAEKKS